MLPLLEFLPETLIHGKCGTRAVEGAISKLHLVVKSGFVLGRPSCIASTCWKLVLINPPHRITHYAFSTTKYHVSIDIQLCYQWGPRSEASNIPFIISNFTISLLNGRSDVSGWGRCWRSLQSFTPNNVSCVTNHMLFRVQWRLVSSGLRNVTEFS
jgi:hypothetical protein